MSCRYAKLLQLLLAAGLLIPGLIVSTTLARSFTGPRKGTLVLTGGEFGSGVIEKFVSLAGGPKANFVYIPTAASSLKLPSGIIYDPPNLDVPAANTKEFEQELAKFFGVEHMTVLHTRDRETANSLTEADRVEVFEKVWRSVKEKYYDAGFNGVDWSSVHGQYRAQLGVLATDEAFYALLNRMLGELKDAHTNVRTPRVVQARKHPQTAVTSVRIREVEGLPVIYSVEPNSDAAQAGVEPGMIVGQIDGRAVSALIAAENAELTSYLPPALERIRIYSRLLAGSPGSSVKLTLERTDHTVFDVTLARRGTVAPPSITAAVLPSGTALLRVDSFRDGIAKQVKAALRKFKDARGLIIDLRNNGGGEVPEMREIAGYFFGQKQYFGRGVNRTGKPLSYFGGLVKVPLEAYVGEPGGQLFAKPIVILIGERTASAAESFTEGMRENDRASVVGSQSCGCVNIVLDSIGLKGGGELHISELGYLSPKGNRLEGIGVSPDVMVELKLADLQQRRDAWIEAAETILKMGPGPGPGKLGRGISPPNDGQTKALRACYGR
ncbi:MAG: S41 family peptidase [Pyrinomonadaceae bacterium]